MRRRMFFLVSAKETSCYATYRLLRPKKWSKVPNLPPNALTDGARESGDTSDLVTSLIPFPPSTSLPPPRIEPSHGELCRCGDDAVLPEGYRIVALVAQRRILGANWAMVPWNTGQEGPNSA